MLLFGVVAILSISRSLIPENRAPNAFYVSTLVPYQFNT